MVGRVHQRLPHPAFLRQAGKAVLEPVQATAKDVLSDRFAARLNVSAVHPNGGRAGKPGLVGGGLVDDQGGPQLRVE